LRILYHFLRQCAGKIVLGSQLTLQALIPGPFSLMEKG